MSIRVERSYVGNIWYVIHRGFRDKIFLLSNMQSKTKGDTKLNIVRKHKIKQTSYMRIPDIKKRKLLLLSSFLKDSYN